jgi:hypothetical protein
VSYSRPRFPDDHFTRIPNAWIRDGNLRPNAKAILFTIMSHDADYKLTTAQIMRETGLGRDAVNAARDHMLERGYLTEVTQTTGERGRFAENHYVVTHCQGIPTPPVGQSALFEPESADRTATVLPVNGPPVTGQPGPIEEQGEKNTPKKTKNTPPPAEEGGPMLRDISGEHDEVLRRAQVLAAEHYEATGKLGGTRQFQAIRARIIECLEAGHPPEQVRPVLAHLRQRGQPLTRARLGSLLADPRLMAAPPGRHAPYRNPPPGSYTDTAF